MCNLSAERKIGRLHGGGKTKLTASLEKSQY